MEISWDAPEHHHVDRGIGWYYGIILGAAVILLISFWQRNILLGVFIILAVSVLIVKNSEPKKHYYIKINEHGVYIGNLHHYRYTDIDQFAMNYSRQEHEEWGILLLHLKHHFKPYVRILVPRGKCEQVKELLGTHLNEFEFEETLTDEVIRILKL